MEKVFDLDLEDDDSFTLKMQIAQSFLADNAESVLIDLLIFTLKVYVLFTRFINSEKNCHFSDSFANDRQPCAHRLV